MSFFVYIHSKPNGIPFYVGKGNSDRIKYVYRNCNAWHMRIINKYGHKNIKVNVYPCDSEEQAFELEKELIFMLRNLMEIELCNLTDGGEGTSGLKQTEEHIKKRSTPESRLRASKTLRSRIDNGLISPGNNKPHTEEIKKIISNASRKTFAERSEEERTRIRLKISLANTGKKQTEESKEKNRQWHLGRKQSEETKAKRAAKHKGRKNTPETKALMSFKAKAREERKRKLKESLNVPKI